jgi:RNA polymerase sigma-70 factor (ECF subfamily)
MQLEPRELQFEELFRSLYRPLLRYACTMLKDEDEAEDIVQQLFVKVWEKNLLNQVHSSSKSMLYQAVYNASLNRIKHLGTRKNFADETRLLPNFDLQEEESGYRELKARLELAMNELPPQCQNVFKLSRFRGYSYAKIADELGISIKTVENHMGKALQILRSKLGDYLILSLMVLTGL